MLQKTFLLLSCVTLIVGCASPEQLMPTEPVCLKDVTVDDAMQSSLKVLKKYDFRIDKLSSELGYLRTKPGSGTQFFEFWKANNKGSYNFAEANFNSIARTVELWFYEKQGQTCVACEVNAKRLSIKDKDIASYSDVRTSISKSSGSRKSLSMYGETEDFDWIDLGRDRALEAKILEEIHLKANFKE